MSSISIDQQVAALIGDTLGLSGDFTVRRIPRWNIDGTEVKSVEQAAVLMGVSEDVAAHRIIEDDGAPHELKQDATSHLQVKVVRHVRTPEGARKYGQPIGSVIVADAPLPNLQGVAQMYQGYDTLMGANGVRYHVTQRPTNGKYIAVDDNDRQIASAITRERLYVALNNKAAKIGSVTKAPNTPKSTKPILSSDDPDVALGDLLMSAARKQVKKQVRDQRMTDVAVARANASKGKKKHGTYAVGDRVTIGASSNKSSVGKSGTITKHEDNEYTIVFDNGNGVRIRDASAPKMMFHEGSKEAFDAVQESLSIAERAAHFRVGDKVTFTYKGQTYDGVVKQRKSNGMIIVHSGNKRYRIFPEDAQAYGGKDWSVVLDYKADTLDEEGNEVPFD